MDIITSFYIRLIVSYITSSKIEEQYNSNFESTMNAVVSVYKDLYTHSIVIINVTVSYCFLVSRIETGIPCTEGNYCCCCFSERLFHTTLSSGIYSSPTER